MYCPSCTTILNCGCVSCLKTSPNKLNKMIVHEGDDNDWQESCPNCNHTMSIYEWFEVEGQQYNDIKNLTTPRDKEK